MRWLRISLYLVLAALLAAVLHYNLPQRDVVRITRTESVREDFTSINRWFYADNEDGTTASGNRDIRFINTVRADGRVMIYRNEDTGFGWPPYFKFDTADLQGEATDLEFDGGRPAMGGRHALWLADEFSDDLSERDSIAACG